MDIDELTTFLEDVEMCEIPGLDDVFYGGTRQSIKRTGGQMV